MKSKHAEARKSKMRAAAAQIRAYERATGDFEVSRSSLCHEARLYLDIGTAFASNGWLRKRLMELLKDLEKAEQRSIRANAKRKR